MCSFKIIFWERVKGSLSGVYATPGLRTLMCTRMTRRGLRFLQVSRAPRRCRCRWSQTTHWVTCRSAKWLFYHLENYDSKRLKEGARAASPSTWQVACCKNFINLLLILWISTGFCPSLDLSTHLASTNPINPRHLRTDVHRNCGVFRPRPQGRAVCLLISDPSRTFFKILQESHPAENWTLT